MYQNFSLKIPSNSQTKIIFVRNWFKFNKKNFVSEIWNNGKVLFNLRMSFQFIKFHHIILPFNLEDFSRKCVFSQTYWKKILVIISYFIYLYFHIANFLLFLLKLYLFILRFSNSINCLQYNIFFFFVFLFLQIAIDKININKKWNLRFYQENEIKLLEKNYYDNIFIKGYICERKSFNWQKNKEKTF